MTPRITDLNVNSVRPSVASTEWLEEVAGVAPLTVLADQEHPAKSDTGGESATSSNVEVSGAHRPLAQQTEKTRTGERSLH